MTRRFDAARDFHSRGLDECTDSGNRVDTAEIECNAEKVKGLVLRTEFLKKA